MDYVKKFLHVEGLIGQGAFGRVLVTSFLQNQNQTQQLQPPPPQQQQQQQIQTNQTSQQQQTNNNNNNTTKFALKVVQPILRPQRLANELRHLRDLGGQCNVVQMHTAHFFKGSLYIVMELIEHDRFLNVVSQLYYDEIVLYMKNLLIALEHVHGKDIMHRDIKPANFLFNRKNKKFLLVDFGLAQKVRPKAVMFGAVANRQFNQKASSSTPTSTYSNSISLLGSPQTPTAPSGRRLMAPLFPEFHNKRTDSSNNNNQHLNKSNIPFVNLTSSHIIHQSPARHYINLTPTGSPSTPNVSTKRQLNDVPNPNDFNQMLKKLRVSNNEEIKEPVRLTVGAYESPVTHNDGGNKRNLNHKFSTPNIPSKRTPNAKCDCRGKPRTCKTCSDRPESNAPKSGTPGFKAPEVLLRYHYQTTAVDIWSAGVILVCLLSGHSPFFRDADDQTALAEVITILGSQKVIQAARSIGIRLNVEPKREPVDLVQLCKSIRVNHKRHLDIPDCAFELLTRMLDPHPGTRITASEALKHPFFESIPELSNQQV